MISMRHIDILFFMVILLSAAGCRKPEFQNEFNENEMLHIKVAASVSQVKSPEYFKPAIGDIYAYSFADPEETVVSSTKQSNIDDNGIYSFLLLPGSDSIMFANCLSSGFDLVASKDFTTNKLTYARSSSLPSVCDLVMGGASLSDMNDERLLSVHLNRMTAFLSASLKFVDVNKNELPITDYVQKVGLTVGNQAVSVSCNVRGDIKVSEECLENETFTYVTTQSLCSRKPMFPTAQGMNAKVGLHLKQFDNSEIVLIKELSYPFERNRHYKLTITVKRTDTAFSGFAIEDIVSETIDIQLN